MVLRFTEKHFLTGTTNGGKNLWKFQSWNILCLYNQKSKFSVYQVYPTLNFYSFKSISYLKQKVGDIQYFIFLFFSFVRNVDRNFGDLDVDEQLVLENKIKTNLKNEFRQIIKSCNTCPKRKVRLMAISTINFFTRSKKNSILLFLVGIFLMSNIDS